MSPVECVSGRSVSLPVRGTDHFLCSLAVCHASLFIIDCSVLSLFMYPCALSY